MKGRPPTPNRHDGLKPLPVARVARDLPLSSLAPEAPGDLPAEMAAAWDSLAAELVTLRVWHEADETLLRRCVVAAYRALQAERLIESTGPLVKGLHGPIVNPALKVERDAAATYLRLAESLGLTPTARMRLGLQRLGAVSMIGALRADLGIHD